jgi:lipopolysaccharide transport system permease protein
MMNSSPPSAAVPDAGAGLRPDLPELVIEPGRVAAHYWRDLWRYRDLFFFLAWRDVAVRYKQTQVGVAWAIVQPALTLLVFALFGRLAHVPTDGTPRLLLIFAALLPWQFFAAGLAAAGNSLASNTQLVTKVYFPRLIIPCSAIITSLVDFAVSLGLYLVMAVAYGRWPDLRFLALPGLLLLAMVAALGSGLWITALNVKYRDFRFVLPFIVQLGLYASPVAFPTSLVPAHWLWLYRLNPMVGVIDGFRWCLLRGQPPLDLPGLAISAAAAVFLLVAGLTFFRRTERRFADHI